MTSRKPIIVAQHSSSPTDLPNHFELSPNNALEMSVDDVATLHARWAEKHEIDMHAINRLFFVVTDEGMSPDLHPKTVLIVKGGEAGKIFGGLRKRTVVISQANEGDG